MIGYAPDLRLSPGMTVPYNGFNSLPSPRATATARSINTIPNVINDEYEVVAQTTPATGAQLVDASVVGTQLPSYVAAEVAQTGLIVPARQTLGGNLLSESEAVDFLPEQSERIGEVSGVAANASSSEKAIAYVKENKAFVAAAIAIIAVGYYSARGR